MGAHRPGERKPELSNRVAVDSQLASQLQGFDCRPQWVRKEHAAATYHGAGEAHLG